MEEWILLAPYFYFNRLSFALEDKVAMAIAPLKCIGTILISRSKDPLQFDQILAGGST